MWIKGLDVIFTTFFNSRTLNLHMHNLKLFVNPLTAKDKLSRPGILTFLQSRTPRRIPRRVATHAFLCNTLVMPCALWSQKPFIFIMVPTPAIIPYFHIHFNEPWGNFPQRLTLKTMLLLVHTYLFNTSYAARVIFKTSRALEVLQKQPSTRTHTTSF